ncbi:MAG: serine/threonine-protein kinase [Wenzhouxiangella sp.]
MTKGSNTLTPMRRRAVDRLLIDYLELPEREQPAWLARTRQRLPRLGRWLVQLVDDSHTVTLLDESVRRVAGESMDRIEVNAAHLDKGDRLAPWEVLEEIGEGGMGRVYRGQRADGAFEMEVAIKQIGKRRRGLAELLQRECRLLAKLDHPSVTRLVDAGLDDRAGPFLVMEWIEGTDLDDWLNSEQPDLAFRLDRFEHILEAVEHAHQRLIVHGDIKPGNIRIATNGAVKLMDFGIARLQESSGEDDAQMRALTPSFAAPEQLSIADRRVMNHQRAQVFSADQWPQVGDRGAIELQKTQILKLGNRGWQHLKFRQTAQIHARTIRAVRRRNSALGFSEVL